jgi:hypothetical protein
MTCMSILFASLELSSHFRRMGAGGSTVWQPYGKTWRKHRTLYHKQLNQTAAKDFQPSQLAAARGLLRLLVESPEDYLQHIRQ